jgi:hypothetical protein
MCANCFFYREGDRPFAGRCVHPGQQLPVDPQPLIRGRELACRTSWDQHSWMPRHFEPTDRVLHVRLADSQRALSDAPRPGARTLYDRPSVRRTQSRSTESQIPLALTIEIAVSETDALAPPAPMPTDIALSLIGHAPLPPKQERACATCRCFVASSDGVTGLCTNLLVSTTFRHVAAESLACDSLLGCWWQPHEPEMIAVTDALHPVEPVVLTDRVIPYPLTDS